MKTHFFAVMAIIIAQSACHPGAQESVDLDLDESSDGCCGRGGNGAPANSRYGVGGAFRIQSPYGANAAGYGAYGPSSYRDDANNGHGFFGAGNTLYGANAIGYGAQDRTFREYGGSLENLYGNTRPNLAGYGSGGYGDPATYSRRQYCDGRQMNQDQCMGTYPDSKVSQWRFIKELGWRKFTQMDAARLDWWDYKDTQRPWGTFFNRTWY